MDAKMKNNENIELKEEINKAIMFYKNGKYASAVICIKKAQQLCDYKNWYHEFNSEMDKNSFFWENVCIFSMCLDAIESMDGSECGCCCGGCCICFIIGSCCSMCGCNCDPSLCCAQLCYLPCQCCCGYKNGLSGGIN